MQQWAAFYNGPGNYEDVASAVALDSSGNVYVTGYSAATFFPNTDYATVKYNAAGVQQWVTRYDGPGHGYDAASALILDACGNVYVTGGSVGNGTSTDYATIKYEQPQLVTMSSAHPQPNTSVVEEAIPAKFSAKAFPNAFTDLISLQWSGSDKPVTITITDATGKLVERRTGLASSGMLKTGNNFTQGIYFAEIVQGSDKIVLKLIKQ